MILTDEVRNAVKVNAEREHFSDYEGRDACPARHDEGPCDCGKAEADIAWAQIEAKDAEEQRAYEARTAEQQERERIEAIYAGADILAINQQIMSEILEGNLEEYQTRRMAVRLVSDLEKLRKHPEATLKDKAEAAKLTLQAATHVFGIEDVDESNWYLSPLRADIEAYEKEQA